MCRIFGFLGNEKISQVILKKTASLMYHGGPDSQNFVSKENWALGNNRLAIQGLDGGQQPYQLGNIFAVFNGEIYNHNALRQMLRKNNFEFSDHCDGSIIPALYTMYGNDFVQYLDGMFAIAIIDLRREVKLLLANDTAGIKSLYYSFDAVTHTLKFASELPALIEMGNVNKEIRVHGIDDYLTGKAIWGPQTIYKSISQLTPASILISSLNEPPKIIKYESKIKADFEIGDVDSAGNYTNQLLKNEVKNMLVADVPVCAVTSGGLDSSYITALASHYTNNLHTFNIWYEGDLPHDERHYANQVADLYKTTHHQVLLYDKDYPDLIVRMIKHLGQPNTAPHSVSTFALFEAVSKAGFKVAITGEGADEFFSGYARFANAAQDQNANWLTTYLDKLSAVSAAQRNELYTNEFKEILNTSPTLAQQTRSEILKCEAISKNRLKTLLEFDQIDRFPYYILRRVDHLSMAHSVEVRVPFCQPRIISLSKQIPNEFKVKDKHSKYILYQAAKGQLPESIMNRPKQPFMLPIAAMLKPGHVLFDFLLSKITSTQFISRKLFKPSAVDNLIQKQLQQPSDNHAEALWGLLTLELWFQLSNINLQL